MNINKYLINTLLLSITIFCLPFTAYAQDTFDPYDLFKGNSQENKTISDFNNSNTVNEESIHDRRIIIKLKDDHAFDVNHFNVQPVDDENQLGMDNMMIVTVPYPYNFEKIRHDIEKSSDVLYAEADTMSKASFVPSQQILKNQWYLNQIAMPKAWKVNEGNKDITIAVLDTGVNQDHPALKGRVKTGRNIIYNKNDATDDNGHGTHVAGIMAAHSNQMTGIDLNATILPIKVLDKKGNGPTSTIIKGIKYAMEQDVDVINMSYVNYSFSQAEEDILWEAYKKGIVLVGASGNDGRSSTGYPASYLPVISVSAADEQHERASFSNYGDWINLTAPGVNIFSTHVAGGYRSGSGTSFSAPIVSALAGMLKAQHDDWHPQEIEWALESTAKPLHQIEWEPQFGFGSVNAYKAFTATPTVTVDQSTNHPKKAMKLKPHDIVQDNLSLPLDMSWYQIEFEEAVNFSIKLSHLPKHLDLVGTLFEENGGELHKLKEMDQGNRGESESIKIALQPGTYYLSVHDYYGNWSKDVYQLKTTATEIDNSSNGFSDVSSYEKQINYLTEKKVIRGYGDGTFKPRKHVTRLQAVQMILNEMNIDVNNRPLKDPGFKDIDPSSYGYEHIATAVELGIIKGKNNNMFDSYGHLTRAQMAAIMVNAYELTGTSSKDFKDVPSNHWSYDVVNTLAANAITKGYEDNTFRPYNVVSREHFAVFLYNKIKN